MNKPVIYNSLESLDYKNRVVVLGNFDGVHKGHQALLNKGYELSKNKDLTFTIFTFYPQIQEKLDSNFKYLITQEKKINLFTENMVDEIITLPFDDNISKITANQFMKEILDKIGAKKIVVGYNFSFGYKGQGTAKDLEKYFGEENVFIIPPVKNGEKVISSTFIRDALSQGDIGIANEMLGYSFELSGKVIHGNKNGRKFGFPTANIAPNNLCILPKFGVYIASVMISTSPKSYLSVVSIGQRPTIDSNSNITVEAHLINYDGNLYNQNLFIKLHEYIREIRKYDSIDELKAEIINDVEKALKYEIIS